MTTILFENDTENDQPSFRVMMILKTKHHLHSHVEFTFSSKDSDFKPLTVSDNTYLHLFMESDFKVFTRNNRTAWNYSKLAFHVICHGKESSFDARWLFAFADLIMTFEHCTMSCGAFGWLLQRYSLDHQHIERLSSSWNSNWSLQSSPSRPLLLVFVCY